MEQMIPRLFFNGFRAICALCIVQVGAATAEGFGADCPKDPAKSATFTFDGSSAGCIVGYRWGTGVLTLENGQQYAFNARGFKAGETGVRDGTITGTVYGLKNTDDFIGHYKGAAGGIVPLIGMGSIALVNAECVFLEARHTSSGINLSLPADQAITIQFAAQ